MRKFDRRINGKCGSLLIVVLAIRYHYRRLRQESEYTTMPGWLDRVLHHEKHEVDLGRSDPSNLDATMRTACQMSLHRDNVDDVIVVVEIGASIDQKTSKLIQRRYNFYTYHGSGDFNKIPFLKGAFMNGMRIDTSDTSVTRDVDVIPKENKTSGEEERMPDGSVLPVFDTPAPAPTEPEQKSLATTDPNEFCQPQYTDMPVNESDEDSNPDNISRILLSMDETQTETNMPFRSLASADPDEFENFHFAKGSLNMTGDEEQQQDINEGKTLATMDPDEYGIEIKVHIERKSIDVNEDVTDTEDAEHVIESAPQQ